MTLKIVVYLPIIFWHFMMWKSYFTGASGCYMTHVRRIWRRLREVQMANTRCPKIVPDIVPKALGYPNTAKEWFPHDMIAIARQKSDFVYHIDVFMLPIWFILKMVQISPKLHFICLVKNFARNSLTPVQYANDIKQSMLNKIMWITYFIYLRCALRTMKFQNQYSCVFTNFN